MGDQKTDDDIGGGGNATFKTTSKSPKTTGAPSFRNPEDETTDNNVHMKADKVVKR